MLKSILLRTIYSQALFKVFDESAGRFSGTKGCPLPKHGRLLQKGWKTGKTAIDIYLTALSYFFLPNIKNVKVFK